MAEPCLSSFFTEVAIAPWVTRRLRFMGKQGQTKFIRNENGSYKTCAQNSKTNVFRKEDGDKKTSETTRHAENRPDPGPTQAQTKDKPFNIHLQTS